MAAKKKVNPFIKPVQGPEPDKKLGGPVGFQPGFKKGAAKKKVSRRGK